MAKILSFPLSLVLAFLSLFGIYLPKSDVSVDKESWNTNYSYVFVHGLSGWGSYDSVYKFMPYWGMFGGELLKKLDKSGCKCYAASVSPSASAWDRACELYAQLTGTRVDYGKVHSEKYGHERYGTDYTDNALIPAWSSEEKINLLGHSFGGATIRMLAHLMSDGDGDEIEGTAENDISPLFTGGKADWIYSLTALAAPHNGTTAYEGSDDESPAEDTAAFDMHIDNALKLNENLITDENTYYFSIPCSATIKNEDGTYTADKKYMESLFRDSANELGCYTGTTKGGFVIDESWLQNDGLVNTVSATAPFNAPSKAYEEGNVTKGVWNVMPTYYGDHMSLQGGLMKTNTDIYSLYMTHLNMINSL